MDLKRKNKKSRLESYYPLKRDIQALEYYAAKIADIVGVTAEEIKSKSRKTDPAFARICLRHLLFQTIPVKRHVGALTGCDHSTVIWSINKFDDYSTLPKSDRFRQMVDLVQTIPKWTDGTPIDIPDLYADFEICLP